MISRLLLICAAFITLSACVQTSVTTIVKKNGSAHYSMSMVSNVLAAEEIASRLNANGNRYQRKMLNDGKVQFTWENTFDDSEYSCKGIFIKECTMDLRLPIQVPDPTARLMLEAARQDGNEDMMLSFFHAVVLPVGTNVKSTNAHSVDQMDYGVSLMWKFNPNHGDVLQMNFTASL